MIIILSSPSGGGKTSLANALLANDKKLTLSISVTTRKARIDEQEARDYFFKTLEEFQIMELNNQFLETAKIYDNFYGTPKDYIEELLRQNKNILFDIDHQGARQIKHKLPKLVISIFIMPPSIKLLEQRLWQRGQDNAVEIEKRIQLAQEIISYSNEYDYVVTNDHFGKAISEIETIIAQEKSKRTTLKH